MNKVALLTFHNTTNFGALLQTFGLYKKLNDLGYDCRVLNYQCANIIKREVPEPFRFTFNPKSLVSELLVKSKMRRRYEAMHQFMTKNLNKMTKPYNRNTVFKIEEDFDSFVVGSDMLWGLDITDSDFSYFLDFVPDEKRKFSYATSIGKREWTNEEMDRISNLLARFYRVSAREEVTAERLKPVLNQPCHVVCDPTMLIPVEEWQPYVGKRLFKKDYILAYFNTDDGRCLSDAMKYAEKNKKELLFISQMPSFMSKTHNVCPAKVEDFLSLIYYADMVFTASYHGMLFSLYFHKKFLYYNRQPAYRMQTVADRLNVGCLEGRGVDLNNIPLVDYKDIDKRMAAYREESIAFINDALK